MKSGISRRQFLRGAGGLLALPLLESLLPRGLRAGPTAPKRFVAYYVPCGIVMKDWTPATDGAGWALTPILQPIGALKSKVSVLTGLANRPAIPDGPGDHASGTGAFLTAAHPYKTDGASIMDGISVDQVAAASIGTSTPFPSLQLGIDGGSSAGGCDSGYSCAYARNISWAGPATPLPKLTDPQTVFDRLFAGSDATLTAGERARRLRYKKSVLDFVIGDAQRLQPTLGATDRHKLDEYLTGVRAVEVQLTQADAQSCKAGSRPSSVLDYPTTVQVMSDLMVLALQCDLTRVVTFMIGNAGSNRTYPFINVPDAHHQISHHMGDPEKLAKLSIIDTWEVQQLTYLMQKMDGITEANGQTLLDNSLVFFSGEIEDGNTHSHLNMPVLLAGSAGGVLSPGRHITYPKEQSFGSLYVSILQALRVPNVTSFGDGMAPLPSLTA